MNDTFEGEIGERSDWIFFLSVTGLEDILHEICVRKGAYDRS